MNDTKRLEKNDWIKAASEVLSCQGIDNVKVGPIAKILGVTRGSFYWHFNKRQDLLDAVLSEWESKSTIKVIETLEHSNKSPIMRLHDLMTLAFTLAESNFSFEKSIRNWALTDCSVKDKLQLVDEQRICYLQQLLIEANVSKADSTLFARQIYFCWSGVYHQASILQLNERLELVEHLIRLIKKNVLCEAVN